MKKNTNKGFTMVELLTTIVILGILMTVSIVAVNKVLENARNKYYVSLEKTVTLATKSYVQDNRNNLPKEIGGKKQIKLKTLQDNNYIKEVQDYNKNACDESSYVEVFKYSKTKYKYVPYLKCGKYNSPDHSMTYQSPKIEIVLPDSKVKKATATINITGQGDADSQKILAYSYVVYKNGKEVINSGSLEGKLKTEIKLNIKINKYTPGEIKVKVTATNINGQKTTKDSSKTYSDMSDPECKIVSGQNTVWTNKSVSITVGCDDGDGVGCAKGEYTKKFTSDTKEGTITISDLAGNETDCKVDVYIDKTAPKCTNIAKLENASGNNYTSGSWTNKSIYSNATCSDSGSGCSSKLSLTATGTTDSAGNGKTYDRTSTGAWTVGANGTSTLTWTVYDNAGNSKKCSTITVKKDTTAPTCTNVAKLENASGNNYTSGSWTNKKVYSTATCSDSESGCSTKLSLTATGTTDSAGDGKTYDMTSAGAWTVGANGTSTLTWTIYDKAGNSKKCSTITVKKDSVAPTCAWTSNYTTWSKGPRTITKGCSDTGGSGCTETIHTTRTFPGDADTRESWKFSAYTIKDNAGNTTSCSEKTVYVRVDNTVPTISSISNSSGGSCTNSDITITIKASDTGSGINNYQYKLPSGDWTNMNNPRTFTATRNSNVQFRVCDKVGLCSLAKTSKICKTSYPSNVCNITGTKVYPATYSYTCSAGHTGHTTGYIHYCTDSNGNLITHSDETNSKTPLSTTINNSINTFSWYCPWDPPSGLTEIDDN